ncbi:hypothetical protein [Dactylosporangium sp. NPDC006015]|uniref:hypothetical protein n=1 Tax=Dactylosporangium sp. NPDC006015 TaxID=3154576 RepID=UPI0033A5CE13
MKSLTRATAAALLALAGAIAVPGAAHATPLCNQPVPPPACGDQDPDPDPGPIDTPPRGALDAVTFTGSGVRVEGWAADGDTAAALQVHVYIDGTYAGSTVANTYRSDVAAVYPYFGAYRGYEAVIPAKHGSHTVCAYAINVTPSGATPTGNPQLGCRTYNAPAISNIVSFHNGQQWMISFDDNVIGETGFTVRWDYWVWYTIPGTHERVQTPRYWTYTLPAHEGTGRVTMPDQRTINATRLTVTAPGFGGASTTDLY